LLARLLAPLLALAAAVALPLACAPTLGVFSSGAGGSSGATGTGTPSATATGTSSDSASTSTSTSTSSAGGGGSSSTSTSTGGGCETGGAGGGGGGPPACAADDCSDPQCIAAGYACVPNVPAGWSGPAAFYMGDPALLPSCPPPYPTLGYQGNSGILDEPAECGACICDPPDVTCSVSNLYGYTDDTCDTITTSVAQVATGPGECQAISATLGASAAYSAEALVGSFGQCTSAGGGVTLPPPVWQTAALLCAPTSFGTGCGSDSVCASPPPAPFQATLCIWQPGEQSCPAGFPTQNVFAEDVDDMRDCTPCSCGGPEAMTCTADTMLYSDDACIFEVVDLPDDTVCTSACGSAVGSISTTVGLASNPGCPPIGGQPDGTIVEGAAVTTVCCQ
jgi:hypothetical protein